MDVKCWDDSRSDWKVLDATPGSLLLVYKLLAVLGLTLFFVFGLISIFTGEHWAGGAASASIVVSAIFAVVAKKAGRAVGSIQIDNV